MPGTTDVRTRPMSVDRTRRFAIIRPDYFRRYGEIRYSQKVLRNRRFFSAYTHSYSWIFLKFGNDFFSTETDARDFNIFVNGKFMRKYEVVWVESLEDFKRANFRNFLIIHRGAFKFYDIDTYCCKAEFIIYSVKINSTAITRLVGHYRYINRFMLMNL